ncbi:CAP domain-containing protein [Streptomyces sannanensis]|uniref:CAP domain-containing protein n=1 Tax=Streptomyces sannanensis TaxID=285536 RepID=UPI0031ED34C6
MRRTCVAACAAPLLLFTGAAAASAATMTTPVVTTPNAVQQVSAGEILSLINAEREKAGCSALTVNPQLTQAAQAHADDMEKNNLTGHTGSDGSDVPARIDRTGYRWRAYAENVSGPGQGTAQAHVTGWLDSPGHKGNIDNCSLADTGVGVAGDRVVQVFATPG